MINPVSFIFFVTVCDAYQMDVKKQDRGAPKTNNKHDRGAPKTNNNRGPPDDEHSLRGPDRNINKNSDQNFNPYYMDDVDKRNFAFNLGVLAAKSVLYGNPTTFGGYAPANSAVANGNPAARSVFYGNPASLSPG